MFVSAKYCPNAIIKQTAGRSVCECRKVAQYFIFAWDSGSKAVCLKIIQNEHMGKMSTYKMSSLICDCLRIATQEIQVSLTLFSFFSNMFRLF